MVALEFPRFLKGKLSNTTLSKATTARMGAIDQRYSPKLVFSRIDAHAETWMIGTILVEVAGREVFRIFWSLDHFGLNSRRELTSASHPVTDTKAAPADR